MGAGDTFLRIQNLFYHEVDVTNRYITLFCLQEHVRQRQRAETSSLKSITDRRKLASRLTNTKAFRFHKKPYNPNFPFEVCFLGGKRKNR